MTLNRSHVLASLGAGLGCSFLAICGNFDPQVRLTNGAIAPNWRTPSSSEIDRVSPGWGGVKLTLALLGVAGFASTIYLSRPIEEAERVESRFRQQEEDLAYQRREAIAAAQIGKLQLEASAEMEAHQILAERKAEEYLANSLGLPLDVNYAEVEDDEPSTPAVPVQSPVEVSTVDPADAVIDTPAEAIATPSRSEETTLSVLIGKTPENQEIYWNPAQQPNGFMLILGSSGAGKTETLKAVTHEIHDFGIPCLILDFHGDIDMPGIETICLSQSPVMPWGVNPMELDSLDHLDGGPFPQVEVLMSMLKTAIPQIGHRQERVVKMVIESAYKGAGIRHEDIESWRKTPPSFTRVLQILTSLIEECIAEKSGQSKIGILESSSDALAKVFEHPVFSKPQQLKISELVKKSHRLDLSKLTPEIQFIVADTVLRKAARQLRSRGHIPVNPESDRDRYRLFVMVDEAKLLSMGGKNKEDHTAIINVLATEYRKFGFGAVFSSQMADHFADETKAQISTRLALKPGNEDKEVKRNASDMRVSESDLTSLRGKGDGWLRVGNSLKRVQVVPLNQRISAN